MNKVINYSKCSFHRYICVYDSISIDLLTIVQSLEHIYNKYMNIYNVYTKIFQRIYFTIYLVYI